MMNLAINNHGLILCGLSLFSVIFQTSSTYAQSATLSQLKTDIKQDSISQTTSVTQLSDIQPTDWSFQALQSLVERYGCIAGYPNGTFRGNRAATRYEVAAALNACFDQISNRFATKEDLEAVKALQEEFKVELATLKGRVDSLEARTATLEAQQFSTTTKLQGEVIMAAQYGDRITTNKAFPADLNTRVSVLSRVRLNFNTSFSGKDLLQTQLEVGNGGQDTFAFVTEGQNPLRFVDGGIVDYAGTKSTLTLRRLAYSFNPTHDLTVTVGAKLFPSDFLDFNSYANNSAKDFSSGLFINNPLIINNSIENPGGAGVAVNWKIGKSPFTLNAVYVAASPTNSVSNGLGGGGLFGDPNQASVELGYTKAFGQQNQNNFAIRLQYTHANSFNSIVATSVQQNVFGLNTEATFGRFGIFGRFGYSIEPNIVGVGKAFEPDYIMTWMVGVAVKDLFLPGSLLAFAAGQPAIVHNQIGSEQTNIEGFFRFPVGDNITITPAVMLILNTENASTNPVLQGLIRASFSF